MVGDFPGLTRPAASDFRLQIMDVDSVDCLSEEEEEESHGTASEGEEEEAVAKKSVLPSCSPSPSNQTIPLHQISKEKGSDFYRKGNYQSAVDAYSEGLTDVEASDLEKAVLLNNRAAAYLMLQQPIQANTDCDSVILLAKEDTTLRLKAYSRKSSAYKQLGNLPAAIDALTTANSIESSPALLKDVKAIQRAQSKLESISSLTNSFHKLQTVDSIIADLGCSYHALNLIKCQAFLDLRRLEDAYNLSNTMMKRGGSSSSCIDLLFIRANILYCRGDLENCYKHLQQCMRSDPDNTAARAMLRKVKEIEEFKKLGDTAYRSNKFSEAVEKYSSCIRLDPNNGAVMAKVYFNRATVYSKLKQHENTVSDCSKAIELDASYVKAFIKRGDAYHILGTPEIIQKAISDYESAANLTRDDDTLLRDLKRKIQQAQVSLKRSKRKDLYAILAVSRDADEEDIKKAYKKAALKYHPDKQAGKSEEDQTTATNMYVSGVFPSF